MKLPDPRKLWTPSLARDLVCAACGKPHSLRRSLFRPMLGATHNIGPCECCGGNCASSGDFTYEADEDNCRRINFTATAAPEGCSCSYSWDFGDGGSGSGATPSHNYSDCNETSFDVTLTITCTDGSSKEVNDTVSVCACEVSGCTGLIEGDGSGSVCSGTPPIYAYFTYGYGSEETLYKNPTPGNPYNCVTDGTGCDLGGVYAGAYLCRLNESNCLEYTLEGSFGSCLLEAEILPVPPNKLCFKDRSLTVVKASVTFAATDATYAHAFCFLTDSISTSTGCGITSGSAVQAIFRAPHGGKPFNCANLPSMVWECTNVGTGTVGFCSMGTGYDSFDRIINTSAAATICDHCRIQHIFDQAGARANCSLFFMHTPP